jgi:hypothetical protein
MEMIDLSYKKNFRQVAERHRLLWSKQLRNGILAILDTADAPCDPYNLPQQYLKSEYDPLAQSPNIEKMYCAWDLCFRLRKALLDDWLPVARVGLGGYELGGMLGGELVFEGGAPWLRRPLLDSWDLLDSLSFSMDGYWCKHRAEMCRYFSDHANGKFACCEGDNFTAMNLVELLRGSKAYLDVIDHPDKCREAITKGTKWNKELISLQRTLLDRVRTYRHGSFSNFYVFLPGNAVWLSMDFYGQCAKGLYAQIGRQEDQSLIDDLGGAWVHMHSNGLHTLEDVVSLKNIKGLQIWEDPLPSKRPFDILKEILQITKTIPLYISCRYDELTKGLRDKTLPGGILYEVKDVPSIEIGNRLMQDVYSYHAPDSGNQL